MSTFISEIEFLCWGFLNSRGLRAKELNMVLPFLEPSNCAGVEALCSCRVDPCSWGKVDLLSPS